MGYDRELIVEINISFIDSLGEVVVITLPMVITETYNSSTIAYEITDYSYYIVPDDLITKDEFNTLVNDFFTDYTNPGVTEQFIMDTYFLSGQYYLDRTNDLPDFNNHSVVETELSHLASYGSNYHIIVRAGVEGSYSYYTYFINVTVDSNGDFYLQCEYPEILN